MFRYRRLSFELAFLPRIFQRYIQQMLTNIEGVCVYLNYILECGSTLNEQENWLKLVLDELSENNIKINRRKCQITKDSLDFLKTYNF